MLCYMLICVGIIQKMELFDKCDTRSLRDACALFSHDKMLSGYAASYSKCHSAKASAKWACLLECSTRDSQNNVNTESTSEIIGFIMGLEMSHLDLEWKSIFKTIKYNGRDIQFTDRIIARIANGGRIANVNSLEPHIIDGRANEKVRIDTHSAHGIRMFTTNELTDMLRIKKDPLLLSNEPFEFIIQCKRSGDKLFILNYSPDSCKGILCMYDMVKNRSEWVSHFGSYSSGAARIVLCRDSLHSVKIQISSDSIIVYGFDRYDMYIDKMNLSDGAVTFRFSANLWNALAITASIHR